MIAHRVQAGLRPDPARVVARLYLPGEELHRARSRASQVVDRVMSLAEEEVERLAAGLLRDFGNRHHGVSRADLSSQSQFLGLRHRHHCC